MILTPGALITEFRALQHESNETSRADREAAIAATIKRLGSVTIDGYTLTVAGSGLVIKPASKGTGLILSVENGRVVARI